MSLASGTRLGPYEILTPLGAGGMGEVYKARDTRLDRVVAVKVILGRAAASPEFRERFEREARAISALDHPHICALHDVGHERLTGAGQFDDVDFLVMQFLEGETLADRLSRASRPTSDPSVAASKPSSGDVSAISTLTTIATISRGPIPIDSALRYAKEIAHALDAAHRRGIVHRDLKPGNVMLTKSGTKLLDFGLAKLAPSPVVGMEDGATRTSPLGAAQGAPLTGQGAILGTLHYMSPEQLEGREVDARSDVFSFGAVLFEMLSGRRAFESPSHAGVIAAIIGADAPELADLADAKARLPVVARRGLERLLRKCLAKDPDERWQSAADLADELAWINEERLRAAEPDPAAASAAVPPSPLPVPRTRERAWMAVAALAVASAGALAVWWYPQPAAAAPPVSFAIAPPAGTEFATGPGLISVSPDGQTIAFNTGATPDTRLWLRPVGTIDAQVVPAADGAWHVAWSPDARSLVFTASGGQAGLKRVDLAGGPARTLSPDAYQRAAWNQEGVILFTQRSDRRLMRVAEAGGPATPVAEFDASREEIEHAWPTFLPDGRRFVFLARSKDPAKSALYLASLDSPARTHLLDVLSMAEYVPGYLLYHREGTVLAHPFDERAGRFTGDPVPIAEDVQFNASNGRAAFAVSGTGVFVSRSGVRLDQTATLTWFDRSGKIIGKIGQPGEYLRGALAPDGRRFVVPVREEAGVPAMDLYMIDVERGVSSRFTSDLAQDTAPVWTVDGQSVVFSSSRKNMLDLYIKPAGGASPERVLFESSEDKYAQGFSPDGKLLMFVAGPLGGRRLWLLPMTGDGKPTRLFAEINPAESEGNARFSPDGKWIAYTISTGPGQTNVFVQPFPPTGYREQISATNGNHPAWTADGRQIAFVGADNSLMLADVAPAGNTLRVGVPRQLFAQRQSGGGASGFTMDDRAQRFLLVVSTLATQADDQTSTQPLSAIVNWPATIKR